MSKDKNNQKSSLLPLDFGQWGKVSFQEFDREDGSIKNSLKVTNNTGAILGGVTILTAVNPARVFAGATGVP